MSFKQRAQTLSHNWRKQKVKDLSRTEMSCSRCGRSGHSIGSCFAKSSVHGRDLMSEKQMRCFRCGRNGHASSGCFARSTVDGRPLLLQHLSIFKDLTQRQDRGGAVGSMCFNMPMACFMWESPQILTGALESMLLGW